MRVLLYGMLRAEGRRGVSAKRKNGGFTLLEMLLTVAILVILLGLSAVGVARWLHPLKITELDNAAREIYMVAENRVVLLKNSGVAPKRLASADPYPGTVKGTSADGTEEDVSLKVVSNEATILDDMLPVGSIDPALREGYFYILYDESTSHVFEVFYAEKPFSENELNALRVSRSDRIKYYRENTAERCLVGHYAGGLADKISNKELPKPDVKVIIENGDELTLTVKYEVPTDSLPAGVSVTRKPKVTLKYGGEEITLLGENGETPSLYSGRMTKNLSITDITNPPSATYTWVLDSLVDGSDAKSQQFRDLFEGDPLDFGDDFTVTASLELTADDYIGSSYSDEGTDNSLFATDSRDVTAYIDNLRHLQNLDRGFSNVAGKTTAIQRADIDASVVQDNKGTVKNSDYKFRPIDNWALTSYISPLSTEGENSSYHLIKNLKITPASARNGHAALFAAIGENAQIQNVRLIDADISNNGVAGALIGYVASVNCTNCLVKNVKVSSTSNHAGGLAGGWYGSAKFENCVVENATVNGKIAGGMAGNGINATFTGCIVKGNIDVSGSSVAGGLAGATVPDSTAIAKFENCRVFTDKTSGSTATVKSTNDAAGGLVGRTSQAEFIGCTVGNSEKSIDINGASYAGGLLGNPYGGGEVRNCSVENAKVSASVSGSSAGGLVGRIESMGRDKDNKPMQPPAGVTFPIKITDCTVKTIEVEGIAIAGGLAGSAETIHFDDCTVIDVTANARAEVGSTAGGLVGAATAGKFDGCRVYWENTSKLGSGNNLNYQVSAATSAGGLVGEITEGGTIQNSFAATLVKANSYVGGLVGRLPAMTESVTIKSSYADCYIQSNQNAGGLIGIKEADGFQLTLTDVYAAGFIEMKNGGMAAGLYSGWAKGTTATNVYAAMHYTGTNAIYPLAALPLLQNTKCYWLEYNGIIPANDSNPNVNISYTQMCDISMGSAFTKNPDTHRYGLGDNADNGTSPYPFLGLKDMPHYGDWLIQ